MSLLDLWVLAYPRFRQAQPADGLQRGSEMSLLDLWVLAHPRFRQAQPADGLQRGSVMAFLDMMACSGVKSIPNRPEVSGDYRLWLIYNEHTGIEEAQGICRQMQVLGNCWRSANLSCLLNFAA
jgi:hypothetical protein